MDTFQSSKWVLEKVKTMRIMDTNKQKWEAVSSFTNWSAQISRIYPKCHGKKIYCKTSQPYYFFSSALAKKHVLLGNCCVTNSSSSRSVRRSKVTSTHSFKTLGQSTPPSLARHHCCPPCCPLRRKARGTSPMLNYGRSTCTPNLPPSEIRVFVSQIIHQVNEP